MARVALYLQDAHPIRDGMHYARAAERAGFEAVWQAESRLVREATIPLAAFGAATERIKLGSGVVSMWVRNPAFLASTFSPLDDLAPGRVLFANEDATALPVQSRRIGFVFQHYALFKHMNVFENVAYGLRVRKRAERPSSAEIRARAGEHAARLFRRMEEI